MAALYAETEQNCALLAAGPAPRPARTRSSCSSRASPTPTSAATRTTRPPPGSNPLRGQDSSSRVPHRGQRQGDLQRPPGVLRDPPGQALRRHHRAAAARRDTTPGGGGQRPRLQQLAGQRLAGRLPAPQRVVFDFYNVLTSNGGNADTNDLGSDRRQPPPLPQRRDRAHHQPGRRTSPAYPSGDSHPTAAGDREGDGRVPAAAQHRLPLLEGRRELPRAGRGLRRSRATPPCRPPRLSVRP